VNRHERRAAKAQGRGRLYTFHRAEGWYPLELEDDEDARKNAEFNPGTLRVEDMDGNVVWRPQ